MINETTQTAFVATRETNHMLMEVRVIAYGHHRTICSLKNGQHSPFPTELLFHTREGAAEYTRARFEKSIVTAEKELKLLRDQMAYLEKIAQRIAA